MAEKPSMDVQAAHKHFAKQCFNKTWDFIDKPNRTADEEDEMLRLCLSSLWHWTQREDCTPTNLSIGYWQVSRVFALLNQSDNARHYAELSLEAASREGVEPVYQGYAHEAFARAAMVAHDEGEMGRHLAQAHQLAASLTDPEEKKQLLQDLLTIH
jgi:hypothetical protein